MDISHWPWLWVALPAVGWPAISVAAGQLSGWAVLARDYRFSDHFEVKRWRFQSAQMRWWVNYNNCLTVGANEQGLFLETLSLLRAGHPRLFVPWRDISIRREKYFWLKTAELRLGREVPIPFRIREGLANRLKEAAGKGWPAELAG